MSLIGEYIKMAVPTVKNTDENFNEVIHYVTATLCVTESLCIQKNTVDDVNRQTRFQQGWE